MLEPVAGVGAALVGERAQVRGERGVVGRDHAALARRHLLVGVEGEHRRVAVSADRGAPARSLPTASQASSMIVSAVLARDRVEGLDVARVAEDVHRQDRARARRDGRLDGRRDRGRTSPGRRRRRPASRARRASKLAEATNEIGARDHLVARPDAGEPHRQVQPGRAARDGDGVSRADEGRELLLEAARDGAEAEHAGAQRLEHVLLLARPDVGPRERDWRAAWTFTPWRASRRGSRGTRARARERPGRDREELRLDALRDRARRRSRGRRPSGSA